jgi:hypothetical protein
VIVALCCERCASAPCIAVACKGEGCRCAATHGHRDPLEEMLDVHIPGAEIEKIVRDALEALEALV